MSPASTLQTSFSSRRAGGDTAETETNVTNARMGPLLDEAGGEDRAGLNDGEDCDWVVVRGKPVGPVDPSACRRVVRSTNSLRVDSLTARTASSPARWCPLNPVVQRPPGPAGRWSMLTNGLPDRMLSARHHESRALS